MGWVIRGRTGIVILNMTNSQRTDNLVEGFSSYIIEIIIIIKPKRVKHVAMNSD
jgi:hypothetical protein